jgi:hypothetical protein
MSDDEYLAQHTVRERLREARADAARQRLLAEAPARPRRGVRAYLLEASSRIRRWRNWRPA